METISIYNKIETLWDEVYLPKKVPLESTEGPRLPQNAPWLFLDILPNFSKLLNNLFSILAWSFLIMVLMNCQKMVLMESL